MSLKDVVHESFWNEERSQVDEEILACHKIPLAQHMISKRPSMEHLNLKRFDATQIAIISVSAIDSPKGLQPHKPTNLTKISQYTKQQATSFNQSVVQVQKKIKDNYKSR